MKLYCLILFILLFSHVGFAQNSDSSTLFSEQKQLRFYFFDIEDGLSNNYINHIEQDSLGFIWIATTDGLNRYDGNEFQVYRKSNSNPKSGPSGNYIQQISIGKEQQLHLATYNGLSTYLPKSDKFIHREEKQEPNQNSVSFILNGPDGNQFMAIYDEGVQILNQDSVIFNFRYSPELPGSISSDRVSSMALQGDSILWLGHFDRGLDKIRLKDHSVTSLLRNHPNFPQNINTLYTDPKGNLWVGSNEGIHVITVNNDTLQIKKAEKPEFGLSDESVLCFEMGPAETMWIGTRNGGINILNATRFLQNQSIQMKWFLPTQDGSSVFNRTVSTLKRSHDGNMWIGTSTGLNVVNPEGEPVTLIQRNISKAQTISHDRIGSLEEGRNGKIWIGTDGGGLDLLDPKTNRIQHFSHHADDPSSLSNNYIISLLEDSRHRVWAGTYQGGLNLLNPITGKTRHYLYESQEKGNDVRIIFESSNGQIWVGTNRGGLYRYHPPIDNFDFVSQLGKIDIRDIEEDDQGNLWLATFGDGIIRYNYLTGEKEEFNNRTIPGFPAEVVFALEIIESGFILCGTRYEGLIHLNTETKKFTHFTETDGLSNNSINSMVKGKDGKIWLGTNYGISYYEPSTQAIGNLNITDNIQSGEFNIGAALVTESGEVYFGGNKGINVFNPSSLENSTKKVALIFKELRLMNKKVIPNEGDQGVSLNQSLPYLKNLNLDYRQSLISLDFIALKFPMGKEIYYSYKLDPYTSQWIETNGKGTANLSNIPPGSYLLKVRAHSGSEIIAENQLEIHIAPPFWKTWPAYLLYLILLILIIYAISNYFAERVQLKNSLLFEKKQRQLEQELNDERNQFFTGFSHELKTPLTLIMAPVDDLISEIKNTKHLKELDLIQKNAAYLHEMISKLLEFRNKELTNHSAEYKNQDIIKPLRMWIEQCQPLAKNRQIKIKSQLPRTEFNAEVDLQKLHIIFNNLMSNALKYCKPHDQIYVSLKDNGTTFQLSVKDTGPGISPEDQENIFNWYYQSDPAQKELGNGVGLAITKRLVEDHGGSIQVKSEPNQGCQFLVEIPYKPCQNKEALALNHLQLDWHKKSEINSFDFPLNPNPSQEKELLLIIDDNQQILHYLTLLLSEEYDLIYAENGAKGLEKANQFIPDLIISDIMMPLKNGIDLCANLKEQSGTTHIPVILLSAKDSPESITSGYGKGADDYITKPFNGQLLKSRVKNLLESKIRMRAYYQNELTQTPELSTSENTAIEREKLFLEELENHILAGISNQNTDVDSISQAMGMSRTSLFRKLKAITGNNINHFISVVKVKKAAELMRSENLGVAQAAYEVGFTSTKHFRKLFKDHFGYLPSEITSTELEQEKKN